MSDVFGPSIDGSDVEAALLAHLELWMPTYIESERERKDPKGELFPEGVEGIREYTVRHASDQNWPEDQLPMLLAHCPGINGVPVVNGDGMVDAAWICNLSAICDGFDMADAKATARLYATAAKKAILQKPDLGGFALATDWADEVNFPVTRGVEAERTLMAVSGVFVISVEDTLDRTAGPDTPDVKPGTPVGKVKEGGGHALVGKLTESGFYEGPEFED
jgi:hypothetical protein